ncbi:MAG TPA: polysaccharide biosynthesis tyrosine autokinase [Gemmatimonadales bacterium]|nr:polysaccharide biosynthesis tyrosine autokinase [Gemmatimonadales bacterium]
MPNELPVPPPVPQPVPHSTALQASQGLPAPMLYGDAQLPGGGPDWRRIFTSVMRFKWLVLGVVVAGTAAGWGLSKFLFKPMYDARATVWVDVVQPGSHSGTTFNDPSTLPISTGWTDLLTSDVVMDWVVREHRLYLGWAQAGDSVLFGKAFDIPNTGRFRAGAYTLKVDSTGTHYTLVDSDGNKAETGLVGDSIGRTQGWLWRPAKEALPKGHVVVFNVAPPHETALSLAVSLSVRTDEDGNFMRLDLKDQDPEFAASTLNAIIERFVAQAADMKREKVQALKVILNEQVDRARAKKTLAEQALAAFRTRYATQLAMQGQNGMPDARDPTTNVFFTGQVTLEQLQSDQKVIQRALQQVDSGINAEELENVPAVQRSTELIAALRELTSREADLRTLRYRYTDEQPSVKRLISEIDDLKKHTIPAIAQALNAQLGVQISDQQHRLASGSNVIQGIPTLAIQDARLSFEVTSATQSLQLLQTNYDQVNIADAGTLPDVKILDPAVEPKRPVGSLAPVLIALAFLGSLGAGVVGAVLLDKTDTRFRYPEQVSTDMGLTILGVVPRVSRENGNGRNAPQVIEALRSIRLGVQNAYGTGPMVLTITSPGSSDGKSFITSNLGLAFADAGLRTIVIDGDIRRGLLHRVLNAKRKPGLIDHLSGNAGREEIIQKTDFPQLSFIGCGQRTPNGPELLSSPAMAQLITSLRARFDVILVDSAPMAAGVDPYVLGTLTGNLLLVMRTGVTDRELAQAKIDLLDRLPVRVLGAVLNDVEAGGAYRYYAYYLAGYEVAEEDAEKKLVRPG